MKLKNKKMIEFNIWFEKTGLLGRNEGLMNDIWNVSEYTIKEDRDMVLVKFYAPEKNKHLIMRNAFKKGAYKGLLKNVKT
tara:strand:- start:1099 stop:1338 length:240 start_codon:yes stop_codon:yes gene_type:complete